MAKSRGPLFSIDARGTLGKSLTFSNWKGIPRVKKFFKPKNPQTEFQQQNRNNITFGVNSYHTLSDFTKSIWEFVLGKKGLRMSGYNYYLSEYNKDMVHGITPSKYPPLNLFTEQPIPDELVSWWKLNEENGSTAFDSISENNGTIYGATHVDGKIGKALDFNGIDNYVSYGHNQSLNITNEITVELWIKPTAIPQSFYPGIISKTGSHSLIFVEGGPQIEIWASFNGAGAELFAVNSGITAGNWSHIVWTYKPGNWIIYINSVQKGFKNQSGLIDINATEDLVVGKDRDIPDRFFNGIIDEVRIYNKALSELEIVHNYNIH